MPKTIRNQFHKNLTFEKLLQAHYRARKHKAYKNEVVKFEFNLENNLINLLNQLQDKSYRLGDYFSFKVFEPKERIIQALPYKDRIVHQWYIEEFIKPYIIPRFIRTTFACLDNKGTHHAVEEVQNQMKSFKTNHDNFWVLKCDIKKFFYNINPYILYNIMKKYITDKDLLFLTQILIFNGPIDKKALGIPIGNYTSQFFANIYLNEFDQYIKRVLKIKCYTRYMDDFILILKSKKECIIIKEKIEKFLHEVLQLELNDKSRYYPYSMGVNFCGYRIFTTHRLLRVSSKKKIKKKVKKWNNAYSNNSLDLPLTMQSLNSWLGHSKHCNSYKLRNKVIDSCDFLYTNQICSKIEKDLISLIEKDISHANLDF
mgnify:CR=1 FL=1